MCCEITQNVITDISEALIWLKNTYFYIRVKKNPRSYGFGNIKNEEELTETLKNLCIRSILNYI